MNRPTLLWPLAIVALMALTGCADAAFGLLAASGASIAAIHRTPLDAVYSTISGRDCSVVWLDRGDTYCRPTLPPPVPTAYCTRSLGGVDCWQDGSLGLGRPAPRGLAEGASTLTPSQEANRTGRWPQVWLGDE